MTRWWFFALTLWHSDDLFHWFWRWRCLIMIHPQQQQFWQMMTTFSGEFWRHILTNSDKTSWRILKKHTVNSDKTQHTPPDELWWKYKHLTNYDNIFWHALTTCPDELWWTHLTLTNSDEHILWTLANMMNEHFRWTLTTYSDELWTIFWRVPMNSDKLVWRIMTTHTHTHDEFWRTILTDSDYDLS